MRMLDLFSGLGGASEAFVRAGWDVVRVENNPLLSDPESEFYVPGTTHNDILELRRPYHFGEPFDFVWASPPCTEFSNAYGAPIPKARRAGVEFTPDLEPVLKAKEIIDYLNPKYWAIENVAGSNKWISQALGIPPWQIIGQYYLWGRFPFVTMDIDWRHSKYDNDSWSTDPLRANKRAKIPLELSEKFRLAVEHQPQIWEWVK
jgi:hypothetical protein